MTFEHKVILVTGGAKGIGEACCRLFHREGGSVVILDWDVEAGKKLAAELGDRALFIGCDVSREVDVEQAIGKAVTHFGRLDVLVNNAGIMRFYTVSETSEADWDAVMNVNIKGAFFCAKHVLPVMQSQGSGVVVNMSSVQAYVAQQGAAAYVVSKSAMIGLTRSIAVDYAPNIRCVAICPGGVDTPMNDEAFRMSEDPERVRQETIDIHLVERMADPEDIAEFVLFVSSEKGRFFTGQPIRLDGGVGSKIAGT